MENEKNGFIWLSSGVCEFRDFELLVSKVAEYSVDDRTVQDIFNGGLYENICIM